MDGGDAMIANFPQNARYNDGQYEIKARVTDVRGGYVEGPKDANDDLAPLQFTLDNYKPFIEEVDVSFQYADLISTSIYNEKWQLGSLGPVGCLDDGMYFTHQSDTEVPYSTISSSSLSNLKIEVKSSEPLDMLTLQIPGVDEQDITFVSQDDARINWIFEVPVSGFQAGMVFAMQFTCVDLSNNALLELQDYTGNTCLEIPTRNGQNTWSAPNATPIQQGTDETFSFTLACGSHEKRMAKLINSPAVIFILDEPCFEVNETIKFTRSNTVNDGSITLDITGAIPPYTYEWSTGSTTQNLSNLGVGQYCVTISDQFCCSENFCFEVGACTGLTPPGVGCPCDGVEILTENITHICKSKREPGSIDIQITNASYPIKFNWYHYIESSNYWNLSSSSIAGPDGGDLNATFTAGLWTLVIKFDDCIMEKEFIIEDCCSSDGVEILTDISNASSLENCDGSLTLNSEGIITPFSINVLNSYGINVYSAEDISSSITINNLCSEIYEIIITNKYGCETTIYAGISTCPKIDIKSLESAIKHPTTCESTDGVIFF